MAEIIRKAIVGYNFLFDELADPRTKTWPLVAKPYQGLAVLAVYLMFVLKWGPAWMKNRQPFNIDKIMIVYNAIQVYLCGSLFILGIEVWWTKYKWVCEPVDYSESEHAMTIANLVYSYYMLKILDLLDTIFFILRKKFNQVSFLHVYHHTGMVLLIWGASTYFPGGHGTLIGIVNSFVHVIMYSYYLLSVAMPELKEYIWLKKHVTQIQIIQFFICVVHMAAIVVKQDCEYPRWTAAVFLPQNLFMLILFLDFYIKTYIKNTPKTPKDKAVVENKKIEEDNEINTNNLNYETKVINDRIQTLIKKNREADVDLVLRNVQRS